MNHATPASDYIRMVVEEILLKPEIADCICPYVVRYNSAFLISMEL